MTNNLSQEEKQSLDTPEKMIASWTNAIRALVAMDINAVLVKTRAYIDTGAITKDRVELLRRQDRSSTNSSNK